MIMDNRFLVARRRYDPDATRYINAVQLADGQALEPEVAMAVDAFVKGCKADSAGYAGDPTRTVWDALKASCILCGARTISGALVPLVGTAPTAQGGWSSGDYSRTAGMTGDGNALYLDSNRANNADPQDDKHISAYITASPAFTADSPIASIARFPTSQTQILRTVSDAGGGVNSDDRAELAYSNDLGLVATTRTGDSLLFYVDGETATETLASNGHHAYDTYVFARNDEGTTDNYTNATLAFYSIGTHIGSAGLAALEASLDNLITAIGEAL